MCPSKQIDNVMTKTMPAAVVPTLSQMKSIFRDITWHVAGILRGIFHVAFCFPLHFMLYRGNFDNFSDSIYMQSSSWLKHMPQRSGRCFGSCGGQWWLLPKRIASRTPLADGGVLSYMYNFSNGQSPVVFFKIGTFFSLGIARAHISVGLSRRWKYFCRYVWCVTFSSKIKRISTDHPPG